MTLSIIRQKNMARVSLKLMVIMIGSIPLFLTVYNWGRCDLNKNDNNFFRDRKFSKQIIVNEFDASIGFQPRAAQSYNHVTETESVKYKEIECVINGEQTVKGRREGKEVYLPFSFIQKYFEVYGSVEAYDGYERLEFRHSYSEVFPPKEKYSPQGVFMSFEFYNVEERARVKCISGIEGVPISTQWEQSGHFYPIQIAQYGLSHYSKHLRNENSRSRVIENGEKGDLSDWLLPDRKSQLGIKTDMENYENSVVEFDTPKYLKNPGIAIKCDEGKLLTLTMDIKFINNGSITVFLRTLEGTVFRVHYLLSDDVIRLDKRDVYYGLGAYRKGQWIHFSRQIIVDLQKGLALKFSKSKIFKIKSSARIDRISVRGHGILDNITLVKNAHQDYFFDAANYLVRHQDHQGGWPIMVTRKLIPEVMELKPGWYSAMGQGQAISLLVRAYLVSKNYKYIEAAGKALQIFEIPSSQGGVLSKYAGVYDWYEEYPTTPSSYVLNGFIYSILGLYDLKEVAKGDIAEKAEQLYDNGMKTLKFMLLMFDSGSGTFYDLRHITAHLPPNRARWDYHTVHINQLYLLSHVDSDPLFTTTAQRWEDYMKGKRSPHN